MHNQKKSNGINYWTNTIWSQLLYVYLSILRKSVWKSRRSEQTYRNDPWWFWGNFPSLCSSSTFQKLSNTIQEKRSSSFQQLSVSVQEDTERNVTTRGKQKCSTFSPRETKGAENNKGLSCNICRKNFSRKFTLERHNKSIH